MSYVVAAISNGGAPPEDAYRKMQKAAACPERPYAGKKIGITIIFVVSIRSPQYHDVLTVNPHRAFVSCK